MKLKYIAFLSLLFFYSCSSNDKFTGDWKEVNGIVGFTIEKISSNKYSVDMSVDLLKEYNINPNAFKQTGTFAIYNLKLDQTMVPDILFIMNESTNELEYSGELGFKIVYRDKDVLVINNRSFLRFNIH